ncbi:Putative uncharacterized protein [Halomonas sp. R57-5]|uniref:hypothetical protein n=1 Tax=Halomonas sp. R57-5 TaxID=1610576 RepID=UPI0005FCBDE1|nr:hypothetical protein [Halomonas sp. R57-5]CEP35110.1 Putative uncharacterized protein [Halomonas sp. R57-5]
MSHGQTKGQGRAKSVIRERYQNLSACYATGALIEVKLIRLLVNPHPCSQKNAFKKLIQINVISKGFNPSLNVVLRLPIIFASRTKVIL